MNIETFAAICSVDAHDFLRPHGVRSSRETSRGAEGGIAIVEEVPLVGLELLRGCRRLGLVVAREVEDGRLEFGRGSVPVPHATETIGQSRRPDDESDWGYRNRYPGSFSGPPMIKRSDARPAFQADSRTFPAMS